MNLCASKKRFGEYGDRRLEKVYIPSGRMFGLYLCIFMPYLCRSRKKEREILLRRRWRIYEVIGLKRIICRGKISLNCKRITTKLKRMEQDQHGISSIPFTLYYSLLLQ